MKLLTKEHILTLHKALIEKLLGVAAGDVSADELIAWIVDHTNEK